MAAVINSLWPRIAVPAVLASSTIISVSAGLMGSGASASVPDASWSSTI